jgi:hypothetical protein
MREPMSDELVVWEGMADGVGRILLTFVRRTIPLQANVLNRRFNGSSENRSGAIGPTPGIPATKRLATTGTT